MEWLPVDDGLVREVLNAATPAALNVPVPRVAVPSMNVTVPAGVPVDPAAGVTVAVKVTLCPATDGLALEVMVVVVAGIWAVWLTVWTRGAEVLPVKLVSPW